MYHVNTILFASLAYHVYVEHYYRWRDWWHYVLCYPLISWCRKYWTIWKIDFDLEPVLSISGIDQLLVKFVTEDIHWWSPGANKSAVFRVGISQRVGPHQCNNLSWCHTHSFFPFPKNIQDNLQICMGTDKLNFRSGGGWGVAVLASVARGYCRPGRSAILWHSQIRAILPAGCFIHSRDPSQRNEVGPRHLWISIALVVIDVIENAVHRAKTEVVVVVQVETSVALHHAIVEDEADDLCCWLYVENKS